MCEFRSYARPFLCTIVFIPVVAGATIDFEPYYSRYFPDWCTELAAGDFDEDGALDLAISQVPYAGSIGGIDILFGASGGFGPPYTVPLPPLSIYGLTAVDLDLDGHLDLALMATSGAFILFGDGMGMFVGPVQVLSAVIGRAISSAGLDGDLCPDLVAASESATTPLLGDCAGGLVSMPAVSPGGFALAIGDLDENGDTDVVTSGPGAPQVRFGDGFGGFGVPFPLATTMTATNRLELADLDADGHLDLAVAGVDSVGLSSPLNVYFGNGVGTFDPPLVFDLGSGGAISVTAGDFDEDGDLDLAVNLLDAFAIIPNEGQGAFAPSMFFDELVGSDSWAISASDFDADGHLDLAFASYFGSQVEVFRNRTFDTDDFRRGDVTGDSALGLDDAIVILLHLFANGALNCQDSGDLDDDDALLVNDPVLLLLYTFGAAPPPPHPWPDCDVDPSGDALSCEVGPGCQ